jgi:dihydroorotase
MQITLTRPDDWHLHLRDGEALASVLAHTAAQFARAIVMPNLKPPVTTVDLAAAYRDRIVAALPAGAAFEPLMTLYLTDNTPPGEVARAAASGFVKAVKLYPAGATTNSDAGLTDIRKADATLAEMERVGLPLLVHGEVTDPSIDLFDREKVFIDTVLVPLVQRFPRLKVVMEHITTQDAAEFVLDSPSTVAATITAHHLLYNRNAIFQGGVRPHWYCLPVLKREMHREALVAAAISVEVKAGSHIKGLKGTTTAFAVADGAKVWQLTEDGKVESSLDKLAAGDKVKLKGTIAKAEDGSKVYTVTSIKYLDRTPDVEPTPEPSAPPAAQ